MAENVASRDEWQAARDALREREEELYRLEDELTRQRRELPWVAVEKEYRFDTEDGPKTLAELFDGRSRLLAYHLMFGESFTRGACPGCSSLADHFDGGVVHLEHRDVTLIAISRAPFDRLQAYKRRMGWRFRWVSSFGSDFNRDFGFASTREEVMADPETRAIVEQPGNFMREWSHSTGSDVAGGLCESPGWNAFAMRDGVVHHTYSRQTPGGPLLGPYYQHLLTLTPTHGDFPLRRHDEY
jgi:predicted dithiol-disulfide oxidoreductase (DUF899 family)